MTRFDDEWRKMLAGEIYDASLPEFQLLLARTRKRLRMFNEMDPGDLDGQRRLLSDILGSCGDKFQFNQPFRCDYGCNIHIGENFFANFNLTVLDEAEVRIGRNAFIGPNVSIYTACHPLDAAERAHNVQWAKPVTIGDDVWIGGGVTILPGVSVGDGAVVGAGAVLTKNVAPHTVVGGNPARVIKRI